MATKPKKTPKATKKAAGKTPAKSVPKKRAASPPRSKRSAAPTGPLTLAEARAIAGARTEQQQALEAAGAVRLRAPNAVAKVAAATVVEPTTPKAVATARRLLAIQQREEQKLRLRDYKATLALLQKHGVKGLPHKTSPSAAAAPLKPQRASGVVITAAAASASGPLRVFAEGDSWFDYPAPFFGGGVIPRLEDRLGIPILNLAKAGDETRFMLGVTQRQLIAKHLAEGCPDGQPWDLMLFSGGGNDIVDEPLALWLHPFDAKKPARQLINQFRFSVALAMVQAAYEDLIALRDRLSPSTHLAFHGYDFAIPDGRGICHFGPWLKPAFDLHGYPADLVVSTAVVKEMLTQFAAMLVTLAKNPGVTFINAQGALPPIKSSWDNELHPSKSGFNQVADRFKTEIQLLFPGRVVV